MFYLDFRKALDALEYFDIAWLVSDYFKDARLSRIGLIWTPTMSCCRRHFGLFGPVLLHGGIIP